MKPGDASEGTPKTLGEMQRELGLRGRGFEDSRGRGLLRVLQAKERQTGKKIVLWRGSENCKRPFVTKKAIRQHAPELMPSKTDALKRDVGRFFGSMDDRFADHAAKAVQKYAEPRFQELHERDQELYQRDEDIAGTVHELARRVAEQVWPEVQDLSIRLESLTKIMKHAVCEECLTKEGNIKVVVAGKACECGHTPKPGVLSRREIRDCLRARK